jgi:hypothetical protein
MSIGGMSQRPADGDPLSLPFFTLQQLLAGISPAIAVFEPDVPSAQCILKALQQTKRVSGSLYPALRIVHQAFPGAGNNMFRRIVQDALFRAVQLGQIMNRGQRMFSAGAAWKCRSRNTAGRKRFTRPYCSTNSSWKLLF